MFIDTIYTILLLILSFFGADLYDKTAPNLPSQSAEQAILVFSKTNKDVYRHPSIEAGKEAFASLAEREGWGIYVTENGAVFSDENLENFDAIIFLSTAGNILSIGQKKAIESFVEDGGGLVGIHAATETEPHWNWYKKAVGATYAGHVAPQAAKIEILETDATKGLPKIWELEDEWWSFHLTDGVTLEVLGSLDESSYDVGDKHMNGQHPIIWRRNVEQGRVFYTGLGHSEEVFANPVFQQHLINAVSWAVGDSAGH